MVPPPSRLRQGRQPKAALCKGRQQKESAHEIRRGVSHIKCCANSEVAALSEMQQRNGEMKVNGWDPAGWPILKGGGGADVSQRKRGGAPDHQGPLLQGIRLCPLAGEEAWLPRNKAGLLTVTYMFGSGAPLPFWQPREAGWEGREVKNGLCRLRQ